eukprot:718287-Pelagomonas_calceolata.AAC.3
MKGCAASNPAEYVGPYGTVVPNASILALNASAAPRARSGSAWPHGGCTAWSYTVSSASGRPSAGPQSLPPWGGAWRGYSRTAPAHTKGTAS